MSDRYLTPNDPDAFLDFPEPLFHLSGERKGVLPEGMCLCAKCKGHGGWNLRVNAYPRSPESEKVTRDGLRKRNMVGLSADMSATEFRHNYVHFRASCDNCNGWGYVDDKQGDHVHEWAFRRNVGNCLNEYTCKTCGEKQTSDSSD